MLTELAVEKALKQDSTDHSVKMRGQDVTVHYGEKQALYDINLDVRDILRVDRSDLA